MKRLIRIGTRVAVGMLGLLFLNMIGVFGIRYVRPVENDPYMNAAEVAQIADDRITFADGRVLRVIGSVSDRTRRMIPDSAGRVDVEVDETNLVTIYGRDRVFVCGLSMPMIIFPVLPSN